MYVHSPFKCHVNDVKHTTAPNSVPGGGGVGGSVVDCAEGAAAVAVAAAVTVGHAVMVVPVRCAAVRPAIRKKLEKIQGRSIK